MKLKPVFVKDLVLHFWGIFTVLWNNMILIVYMYKRLVKNRFPVLCYQTATSPCSSWAVKIIYKFFPQPPDCLCSQTFWGWEGTMLLLCNHEKGHLSDRLTGWGWPGQVLAISPWIGRVLLPVGDISRASGNTHCC